MDNIRLIGAEDVQRASHAMRLAAEGIQSAANSISFAFEQHQRWMDTNHRQYSSRFFVHYLPPPEPRT